MTLHCVRIKRVKKREKVRGNAKFCICIQITSRSVIFPHLFTFCDFHQGKYRTLRFHRGRNFAYNPYSWKLCLLVNNRCEYCSVLYHSIMKVWYPDISLTTTSGRRLVALAEEYWLIFGQFSGNLMEILDSFGQLRLTLVNFRKLLTTFDNLDNYG